MTTRPHYFAASALAVVLLGLFFPVHALLIVVILAGLVWALCLFAVWAWLILGLFALWQAGWDWWRARQGRAVG